MEDLIVGGLDELEVKCFVLEFDVEGDGKKCVGISELVDLDLEVLLELVSFIFVVIELSLELLNFLVFEESKLEELKDVVDV